MTMNPLYPCGKLCSTGTHSEIMKNLALFPVFDRSNHERTTSVALFKCRSSKRKWDNNHVKQAFNQRVFVQIRSFNATFSMFLRPKHTREIFNCCRSNFVQDLVKCIIQMENSTALFSAKSRNLVGTQGIAEFGPK